MLDAALQLCACASPGRRGDLWYGRSEESARTTIAELRCVRVRDVDAVCLGRSKCNQHPSNKTLGRPSGRKKIKAAFRLALEVNTKNAKSLFKINDWINN